MCCVDVLGDMYANSISIHYMHYAVTTDLIMTRPHCIIGPIWWQLKSGWFKLFQKITCNPINCFRHKRNLPRKPLFGNDFSKLSARYIDSNFCLISKFKINKTHECLWNIFTRQQTYLVNSFNWQTVQNSSG